MHVARRARPIPRINNVRPLAPSVSGVQGRAGTVNDCQRRQGSRPVPDGRPLLGKAADRGFGHMARRLDTNMKAAKERMVRADPRTLGARSVARIAGDSHVGPGSPS